MKKIALKFGLKFALIIGAMLALTAMANVANADEEIPGLNCATYDTKTLTTELQKKTDYWSIKACLKQVKTVDICGMWAGADDKEDLKACEKEKVEAIALVQQTFDIKAVKPPIEDRLKDETTGFGAKAAELKLDTNACVKEAEAKTHIFVYTEEGLEDNPQDPEGNIRNCYRVTACVAQEKGDSLDCASYNIREPDLCSDLSTSVNTSGYPKKTLNCEPIQVIRGTSGVEIIYTYIGAIYRWGASVVGIIAVLLLVVSGIQISAAAGDQQAVTDAKNRIFQSLAGLAILFLSGIILYTINPTFFVS